MRQFLKIWLILFLAHLFAARTVSLVGFRHLDLRYQAFVITVVVPLFQAVVLWRITRGPSRYAVLRLFKESLEPQSLLVLFFSLDLTLLGLGWSLSGTPWIGLGSEMGLAGYYTGLKALAGGFLAMALGWRWKGKQVEQGWMLCFGLGLAVYGLDFFVDWLKPLPGQLFPKWPLLFQWFFVYGVLFGVSLAALVRIETLWQKRSEMAALFLACAVGLALVSALIVVLNLYNKPSLSAFWSRMVNTCGFFTVSFIWFGLLVLWKKTRVN